MIDILTQKFTFAQITPFKDYCKLSDKNISDEIIRTSSEFLGFLKSHKGEAYRTPSKKKRRVNYFTDGNRTKNDLALEYMYNGLNDSHIFETTKDRHIRRHYGRALSKINVFTLERSIRIDGDKLIIKFYVLTKIRELNCIYFRKHATLTSLTINLKTGNFVCIKTTKSSRISYKSFKTNSFKSLKEICSTTNFFQPYGYISKESRIYDKFSKTFDNVEFTKKIKYSLGIDLGVNNESHTYSHEPLLFFYDLTRIFVDVKKIKVPNGNYGHLLSNYYPTEKYLKKNDRKLIASILDMFGVKSKLTIKILHEYTNINLMAFIRFCSFFGDDFSKYIGNIQPTVFKKSKNEFVIYGENYDDNKFNLNKMVKNKVELTTQEKENLIKIVNSTNHGEPLTHSFIQLIEDHFSMIQKIRKYDPNLQMCAKTKKEFDGEHDELSKIVSSIKKGWVIEYKFSERMSEDIESPIQLDVDNKEDMKIIHSTYYPHILRREEQYIEEGSFMHHCVATYSDKDRSIIISLRTNDSSDRVTCEFDCQTGNLIQARHFCNAQPPPHMYYAIVEYLLPKAKKYARLGLLHALEKIKVPIMINGVEVKKEEPTYYNYLDF